ALRMRFSASSAIWHSSGVRYLPFHSQEPSRPVRGSSARWSGGMALAARRSGSITGAGSSHFALVAPSRLAQPSHWRAEPSPPRRELSPSRALFQSALRFHSAVLLRSSVSLQGAGPGASSEPTSSAAIVQSVTLAPLAETAASPPVFS